MSTVRESWPISIHDAMELPDGRTIGLVPSGELAVVLTEYGVPGCSPENGRATNIEAYARHVSKINEKSGSEGVARWIGDAKRRVMPQTITFRQTADGVFVVDGWPSKALIETELLTNPSPWMAVDGHVVTFGVRNGFASYRKRKDIDGGWFCTIGEHEYVPDAS